MARLLHTVRVSRPQSAQRRHATSSPLRLPQESMTRSRGSTQQRKGKRKKQREPRLVPYSSSADAVKEGVGRNIGNSSCLLGLHPPFRFSLSPPPGAPTLAPRSPRLPTSLPTFVAERKSSTPPSLAAPHIGEEVPDREPARHQS